MTKLVSTAWASTLLGLAFTGAAVAQTAPNDTQNNPAPMPTPSDGTAMPSDGTAMPSHSSTTTTITPPAPVDVNVNVETPAPVVDTDYRVPHPMVEERHTSAMGIGLGIAAGGGAGGFVNDSLRNSTNVGGDWDVRATIGTRSLLAVEGSYIGSAQGIKALGVDNNALLVGNGVQGALRFNATFNLPIQPFAFAGVGWRRYDLTNTNQNLSDLKGSDDVLEMPLGLGIAGHWSGLMLDARGEYRLTTGADLLPTGNGSNNSASMNRWGLKGTVGVEF